MKLDILLHKKHPTSNLEEQSPRELAPHTWKEIRLFLSSSFIDTHAERDAIIKSVIPDVNRQLASKFIRFIPVDLRWGVLKEESRDCYAIQKTCLNQLDNCRQDIEEYPWFLGLRTERYGWVQDQLLEGEFFDNPQRFDWVKTMQKSKKEVSITSLECIHATTPLVKDKKEKKGKKSETKTKYSPTIFFYKRHITNPEDIEENLRWIFDFEYVPKGTKLSPEVQYQYVQTPKASTYQADRDQLDKYLESLDQVKYSHYNCGYVKGNARFTSKNEGRKSFGVGYVSDLDDFIKQVKDDLLQAVENSFKMAEVEKFPENVLQSIQHENALRLKAKGFVGRSALCENVWKHCNLEATQTLTTKSSLVRSKPQLKKKNGVMIVHGDPGCGKSALLAYVSTKCVDELRNSGAFVFVHAVDSCPGSANLEAMLRRLQLNLRQYRFDRGETDISLDCPKSAAELKQTHMRLLEESASKYPSNVFVILIDAVNQLHEGLQARSMWWLPSNDTPANLRFVVSTLNQENGTFDNACEVAPHAKKVSIERMRREDGEEMVSKILAKFNKKLTTTDDTLLGNQMEKLLSKNLSPLYLTSAAYALRRFGIFEELSKYISNLPDDICPLFSFLLDEWCTEYGDKFTKYVTGLLCVSRDGLLENQINDILLFIEREENLQYDCSFSRIYDSISNFLAAGGGGFLRFFHDQLKYEVRRKFFNPQVEQQLHKWMIKFYEHCIRSQLCHTPSKDPPAYYTHCLGQIVFHQLQLCKATKSEEVSFKNTLRNIYFVRERIVAKQEDALQQEYIEAIRETEDQDKKKALKQWAKFAQVYSSYIKQFPMWIHNMAINQTPSSSVAVDTANLPGPAAEHAYYWSNISNVEDAIALKYTSEHCMSCAGDVKENLCCVGGEDKAWLYELDTGILLHQVEVYGDVTAFLISPSHNRFWAGDSEGTVTIWNTGTGVEEWKDPVSPNNDAVLWLGCVGDNIGCGTGMKGGARIGFVYIFDENENKMIKSWSTKAKCSSFCFFKKHKQILSSHKDGIIKSWSLDGELLKELKVHENRTVTSVKASPSDDTIALVLEETVTKFSVKKINYLTGEDVFTIAETGDVVSYDHSGDRIICSGRDEKTILVYNKDGHLENHLKGHSTPIVDISVVGDSNQILTAADDGSFLYELPATDSQACTKVEPLNAVVSWCSLLSNSDEFATLSKDGELAVWSTLTLAKRTSLTVKGGKKAVVHPDGKHIVVYTKADLLWIDIASMNTVASIMDLEKEKTKKTFLGTTDVKITNNGFKCVVLNADGASVYNIHDTGNMTKNMEYRLHEPKNKMWSCAIHCDNETVVCGGEKNLNIWNLNTGKMSSKHNGTWFPFEMFLYDPDRLLYVDDDSVYIPNMSFVTLMKFGSKVEHYHVALDLLPGGCVMVTGEQDNTIRVHDVETGTLLYSFIEHRSEGFTCLFAEPQGSALVAYNKNGLQYVLKSMNTSN